MDIFAGLAVLALFMVVACALILRYAANNRRRVKLEQEQEREQKARATG
jgi:hypothetical protein